MSIRCPSCGHENQDGDTRCSQCLHTLMDRHLPVPLKEDPLKRMLLNAPLSAIVVGENLLVASANDSLQKIVSIFKKKKKTCVLIYEKKKLVGILSLRTLLNEAACKYPDLSRVTAGDIMSRNPVTATLRDPINFAVNKMSIGGYRHVPVLADDGTPISIISIKDVLVYLMDGVSKDKLPGSASPQA
jgi:CBS domain-containing protein